MPDPVKPVSYDHVVISDHAKVHLGDVHNHYHDDSSKMLAALGAVAAAMQFFDFSSELLTITNETYESEHAVSRNQLKKAIRDLKNLLPALTLKEQASPASAEKEELALRELLGVCKSMVKEIIGCMNKVLDSSGIHADWSSLAAAVNSIWSRHQMETMVGKLARCRAQITPCVLLLLNASLVDLKLAQNEVLEVVAIISESWSQQIFETKETHSETVAAITKEPYSETVAAITKCRDGSCRAIVSPGGASFFSQIPSNNAQNQTLLRLKAGAAAQGVRPFGISRNMEPTQIQSITCAISDALHFRSIRDRSTAVSKAHQETFRWVFETTLDHETPWHCLTAWLRSGSGCYWINGKAGSGKSTLMKYIFQDPRLKDELSAWVQSSELVVASYFFWYAGNSLQKSRIGLIRSLLFDIIAQRPDMAFVLFPDVCRHILSQNLHEKLVLSEIELRNALSTLSDVIPPGLRLFFLVDGIDEYTGDNSELFILFSTLSRSSSIKILLSSRPTSCCLRVFGTSPRLQLQDLTRNDIRGFAEDELRKHPVMVRLDQAQPGSMADLVAGLTEKASGVFLWVSLAVKRLQVGLDNYDPLPRLMKTLDELPEDLEKFYDLMLASIDPIALPEGARMMDVLYTSVKSNLGIPLSVLQLSYVEDGSYKDAVQAPIHNISKEEEEWRCEATEGRMRSRCCGLLEVQKLSGPGYSVNIVTFLHRTVFEFLKRPHRSAEIGTVLQLSTHDTHTALIGSGLKELKGKIEPERKEEDCYSYFGITRILNYIHSFRFEERERSDYIAAIETAMSALWYDDSIFKSSASQSISVRKVNQKYSKSTNTASPHYLILSTALQCPRSQLMQILVPMFGHSSTSEVDTIMQGLSSELTIKLMVIFMEESLVPIRVMALRSVSAFCRTPEEAVDSSSIMRVQHNSCWKRLISSDLLRGWSLWKFVLHYMNYLHTLDLHRALLDLELNHAFCTMVLGLLKSGASVKTNICVLSQQDLKIRSSTRYIEAATIIMNFLDHSWNVVYAKERQTFVTSSENRRWMQSRLAAARLFSSIEQHIFGQSQNESAKTLQSVTKHSKPLPERKPGRMTSQEIPGVIPNISQTRRGRIYNSSPSESSSNRSRLVPPAPMRNSDRIASTQTVRSCNSLSVGPALSAWRQHIQTLNDLGCNDEDDPNLGSASVTVKGPLQQASAPAQKVMFDKWSVTPPSKRIILLDPEDQEMARRLSTSTELPKAEARALTNRFLKIQPARRERILECSKTLAKSATKGG